VDPGTPPGEYRVELDLGGQSRPAILHVTEVFALSLTPDSVVVANRVGLAQTRRVIVANEGNVPFRLDDPGPVELYEDVSRQRLPRLAVVPPAETEEPNLDALVVAVLAVAREETRARHVRVRTLGPDLELHPGETKAVELEITLEDELPPGRRYRGHVPLLTRDLAIVVVASGGPLEQDAPPVATRAEKVPEKSPRKRGGTP
jgi:hypothetical protein